MNFATYNGLLVVPQHLESYLSADGLSKDYWNRTVTVDQYQQLQQQSLAYFGIESLEIPPFKFEIKVEDLDQYFPRVPRYHDRQGLIFIWSIDLNANNKELPDQITNYANDGLQFKSELQHIKSSVSHFVELCCAQIYIEQDYIFVGILKTPGWFKRCDQSIVNSYYKLFWKNIIKYAKNKTVIVPTVSYMNDVQKHLNQRTISFGPYHQKIMHRSGFRKQLLGPGYSSIRILPTQEIWYHGN